MENPEKGQLFLEDWAEEHIKEPLKHESLELERDDEDCKVCGDSGPCSVCERGIALAKEQGNPYRRSNK